MCATLDHMIMEGLSNDMTWEGRLEWNEGQCHGNI